MGHRIWISEFGRWIHGVQFRDRDFKIRIGRFGLGFQDLGQRIWFSEFGSGILDLDSSMVIYRRRIVICRVDVNQRALPDDAEANDHFLNVHREAVICFCASSHGPMIDLPHRPRTDKS